MTEPVASLSDSGGGYDMTTQTALGSRGSVPFVTVIIPVRNEAVPLHAAITAVLAGSYPADRLEVVVADGGSTDGTRVLADGWSARDPRVRRVDNPAGTTPAGLNAAMAAARGEVIVRIDAHTVPAPDYVERCVVALDSTGAGAVGGSLTPFGRGAFGEAVALAMSSRFGGGPAAFRHGGQGAVDTVYLGAWRREILEAVGGFDPDWAQNQDYELNVRLRKAGGLVWLDPAIQSKTLVRSTPGSLARQYFGYGLGRAATVRRHPASLRIRQLLPAVVTGAGLGLVAAAPLSKAARRGLVAGSALYAAAAGTAARARVEAAARDAAARDAAARDAAATHDARAAGMGAAAAGKGAAAAARDAAAAARHAAAAAAQDRRLTATVAVIFALMHAAWGLGFWVGLVRGALEGREPLFTSDDDA